MTTGRRTLLAVGRIAKAFGLTGELVVQPMTEKPARFHTLHQVLLGSDEAGAVPAEVEHASVEPRGVRLKLRGVDDRTSAERHVGSFLFVDARHRMRVPRGRYFVHELVGLEVLDDAGARVGVLRDVLKMPAQDVYLIDAEGREIMVPAVKEFIRAVDLERRVIRVRLIEGMLDT